MSDRLELIDATAPMRNAKRTHVVLEPGAIGKARWDALVADVVAFCPLGETRDLIGEKRHNKGISLNSLTLSVGNATARIDYLPSHVDEDYGDPALRILIESIRLLAL